MVTVEGGGAGVVAREVEEGEGEESEGEADRLHDLGLSR